eukprot:TRINITY_DN20396_c0_g1_i1.p1 TRINITY_DN20396_c0_g1~~TRINITY_DN20396_c0_g1_i1.p1  ORF type:complete len:108 (+),score=13.52 TRINITY_DN20396_c0_g1_i1:72-395(+)
MNQLKDAEKKASQLVNDARKARVDRMKEAKSEAEQAIAAYRAEMEAEYQKNVQANSAVNNASDLDKSTNEGIQKLSTEFNSHKAAVEKLLIDQVCNVHVEAPKARNT